MMPPGGPKRHRHLSAHEPLVKKSRIIELITIMLRNTIFVTMSCRTGIFNEFWIDDQKRTGKKILHLNYTYKMLLQKRNQLEVLVTPGLGSWHFWHMY